LNVAQRGVSFVSVIGEGSSLTTAQLAQRTGVPAGTLRMWEARYGFPVPERRPGGHHRYSDQDAEAVLEVLRLRELGLSVSAAIERVRSRMRAQPASIFAGLRSQRPDIPPVLVRKRALLEITRAIEDEYCARAGAGVLIASFQRERYYRQSERRWRELSRTAELAIVLADFPALRVPTQGPIEIPIRRDQALSREWTLIVDAPQAHACLAAWEHAGVASEPDGDRRFELLWSFEPVAVHAAAQVACGLIENLAPDVSDSLQATNRLPPPPSAPELRSAAGLAQRIVGYLVRG
jgi:DICT domain-containing protein